MYHISNLQIMTTNRLSIITVRGVDYQGEIVQKRNRKNYSVLKNVLKSGLSGLVVITFCVGFAIPWTIIPRTNSIAHQSYWLEVFCPVCTSFALSAGSVLLDLISWTKERTLISVKIYLKMYLMIVIPCFILYIACYIIWCIFLQFNHPLPYLAIICLFPTWIILPFGLWFILPQNLLMKDDFRRKLKMYMKYFSWFLVMVVQNESLSLLFVNVPGTLQVVVIMLVIGCQKFDMKFRSQLISKMMGQQDETAMVLLSVNVGVLYSIFISVRLVGAELATVCCSVFIGFVSHFIMTYHIIKDFRKVTNDQIDSKNREKKMRITKLVITELIEGFTPIIYGVCIGMAYYGPNAHLFSNIGNTYWSLKMDDIGPVFRTMCILFFVDTFSVIINSFLLWRILHVDRMAKKVGDIFRQSYKRYYFIELSPYFSFIVVSNCIALK